MAFVCFCLNPEIAFTAPLLFPYGRGSAGAAGSSRDSEEGQDTTFCLQLAPGPGEIGCRKECRAPAVAGAEVGWIIEVKAICKVPGVGKTLLSPVWAGPGPVLASFPTYHLI